MNLAVHLRAAMARKRRMGHPLSSLVWLENLGSRVALRKIPRQTHDSSPQEDEG
jgi:hypothetical protein